MKKSIICLFMIFLVCMIQPAVADTDPFQITMEEDRSYAMDDTSNVFIGDENHQPIEILININNTGMTNDFTINGIQKTVTSGTTETWNLGACAPGTYTINCTDPTQPYLVSTTEKYSIDVACTTNDTHSVFDVPWLDSAYIPTGNMTISYTGDDMEFDVIPLDDPNMTTTDYTPIPDDTIRYHVQPMDMELYERYVVDETFHASATSTTSGKNITITTQIWDTEYQGTSSVDVEYTAGYYHDYIAEWYPFSGTRAEIWDDTHKVSEYTDDSGTGSHVFSLPHGSYTGKIYSTVAGLERNLTQSISINPINEPTTDIYGYILDSNAQPLPGAVISAGTKSEISNRDGFFSVDGTGTSDIIVKCTGYNDKYIDDANGETIVHMTKTDGAGTFYEDHTVTMIFMEGIFSRYSNEHVQIKQQETNTVVFDGYTDSNGKITKILEKQVLYDIYLNDVLVHSCRPSDSTYYIMPGSDSGDIIDVPAGSYNISIEYSDYTNSTYLFEHESEREAIISCDQEFLGKFILVEENPDDGTVQYTQLWEGTVPEGTSRIAGNTSHDYILRSPTSIYHIDMSEKHTDWILSAVVLIMTIILGSMAGSYNPEAGALSATVLLWVAYLFEIPILTFGHLTVITMIVAAALIGKHARKEGV